MSLGVPSPWYGWVGRTISLVLHFMSSSLLLNYVASRLASLCTSLPTYSLSSMSYYERCPTFFYSKAQLSIVINSHTVAAL